MSESSKKAALSSTALMPAAPRGIPKGAGRIERDAEAAIEGLNHLHRQAQRRSPRPDLEPVRQRMLADIRADARLRSRLEAVGSKRAVVRNLADIPEGMEADDPADIAAADLEGMILSLWSTLEWARERGLPPHHCDNLMALYEGLTLTRDGTYYYAFQPRNPTGKRISPTQLLRRGYVAAAINALIIAGRNQPGEGKAAALQTAAEKMKDARRADFALKAHEKIDAALLSGWYGDFTRRRGAKGSLDGTAAKAQYEKLVTGVIQERAKEGPAALKSWAFSILNAVINRFGSES